MEIITHSLGNKANDSHLNFNTKKHIVLLSVSKDTRMNVLRN